MFVPLPAQDEAKLPYFPITEVPSKFMCYPEGLEISYRRYGWLEMKVLSQRRKTISLMTQLALMSAYAREELSRRFAGRHTVNR
jgi:hypothetical protein